MIRILHRNERYNRYSYNRKMKLKFFFHSLHLFAQEHRVREYERWGGGGGEGIVYYTYSCLQRILGSSIFQPHPYVEQAEAQNPKHNEEYAQYYYIKFEIFL